MTDRCRCIHCDDWFTPDEFEDEDLCEACRDDQPTLQGRIDDEATVCSVRDEMTGCCDHHS